MALAKKSVHLPEERAQSPNIVEPTLSWLPSSIAIGALSRLVAGADGSSEQVFMSRDTGHRGERVTEAPSTSATSPKPAYNGPRRRKLITQPVAASSGRQGPSNLTRLPDIHPKPRSSPTSPSGPRSRPVTYHGAHGRRVSIGGLNAFVAGATVAGPLSASASASATTTARPLNSTAVTAAALFALSAGQTITAASIAYTAGNGAIGPTATAAAAAAASAEGRNAGSNGSGAGAAGAGSGVSPEPRPSTSSGLTTAQPAQRNLQSQGSAGVRGLSAGGEGLGLGPSSALSATTASGGVAAAGGAGGEELGSFLSLQAEDVLGDNDRLRSRLVSLPNIVCRSANGDVFLVDLGNVQAMLHKRELGEEGLSVLSRITPGLAQAIGSPRSGVSGNTLGGNSRRRRRRGGRRGGGGGGTYSGNDTDDAASPSGGRAITSIPSSHSRAVSPLLTRSNSMALGRGRAKSAAGAAAAAAAAAAAVASGDPVLDEELRAHLEATDEVVEQRRRQLQEDWRQGRMMGVSPAAAARELEEAKRAAAIDFAVNTFVPRRLALMAHNMRAEEGGGEGDREGSADSLQGGASGAVLGADLDAGAPVKGHKWGKVQVGMDRLYDKMPFMSNWVATIKKMHREEAAGWDGLIHGVDELYVKGREEHQGTNIYVLKCQELGVTPSTQVIQQLSSPNANMSHCHLGRQGAAALRHALSANVTITHLNLQNNHLDATAMESILAGLYSGTMAKQPRARKLLEKRIQTAAATLANAFNSNAGGGATAADGPTSPGTAAAAASARGTFLSPSRRQAPGDLAVRLIPANLLKEQEQRRLAEEERQRQEEVARLLEEERQRQEAAAAAAAGLSDAPEWLKIINDPSLLASPGGARPPSLALTAAHGSPPGRLPRGPGASAASHHLTCAITSLDLSNNPLGINGVRALADLLDPAVTPYQFVKQMLLNKCGIPETGGRALAGALSRGNTRLAVLGLSNNSLGNATAEMFGEVLALPSGLEDLDLSWNQIKADGAALLAEGLAQNNTLTRLNLSWNGLESPGVIALGNMLTRNESLMWLDLTNTRMGAEACLMLADGIKHNRTLEWLVLNGNSVGDDGARFLMDALKTNNSLRYLGLQGTNMSAATRGNTQASSFNPLAPDGTYHLDLSLGPDRTVALKLCEMDASAPVDLMKNIRLGDRNIQSCKAMKWPDGLPVSGLLTCDFVTRRTSKVMGVIENKKFTALATQFQTGSMSDKEKLALVEVMAPFNYLLCHQAAVLIHAFSIGDEMVMAAALLFTRCADLDENITEITRAMGAEASTDSLQGVLGWYSHLRFSNPTGHYELALSSKVHASLASRLKDVAYSEPVEALNWHNIIHDQYTAVTKVPSNFGPPEDWKGIVPTIGTLSFDFVSGVCVAEDAQPISDDLLTEVIKNGLGISLDLSGRPIPSLDYQEANHQLARLRPLLSNMVFTCAQVKRLVDSFVASPHRVEVLVMCYCLIVDRSSNLWTVLYGMDSLEQALAMWRLGPANVFDKSHCTGHYVLDLHNPHHEAVARKLVDMALAVPELPNFWNLRLNGVRRAVTENRNMWGTFTAETQAPFIEFDYIGLDGFEILGRTKTEVEALGPGDRLDLRTKQAKRMEACRLKAMYAYFEDGSGWQRPAWQSRQLLMKALAEKAPWQAAWDRMLRILLRADIRRGGVEGDSPVEDVFYGATNGEEAMTLEQWEAVLREWGYNRLEVGYLSEAFESVSRAATPKDGPAYKPTAVKPATPNTAPGTAPGTAAGLIGAVSSPSGDHHPATGTPQQPHGSPVSRSVTQRSSRQASMGVAASVAMMAAAVGSTHDSPLPSRGGGGGGKMSQSAADLARSVSQLPQMVVPNQVLEFPAFVSLFMREPPRTLRNRYSIAPPPLEPEAGGRARRGGKGR